MIQHKNNQNKKKLATALIILASEYEKSEKRYWVQPILELRKYFGFYEFVFPTLSSSNMFHNYIKTALDQFESILHLVGPLISKRYVIRIPIPAGARLAMTLRFA